MQDYEVILFDFDGVLCNSEKAQVDSFLETFDHYGQPRPSNEMLKELLSAAKGVEASFRIAAPEYFKRADVNIHKWLETSGEIFKKKKLPLFDGVDELLMKLHQEGKTIIIVSHNKKSIIEEILRPELKKYVNEIVGIDEMKEVSLTKKDPDLFPRLIHPLTPNVPKGKMIIVGDAQADLELSQNAEIDACWVTYGSGGEKCREMEPKYVVDTVEELESLLTKSEKVEKKSFQSQFFQQPTEVPETAMLAEEGVSDDVSIRSSL